MSSEGWLFEGEYINGYRSNELDLARKCPAEFCNTDNSWHIFAKRLIDYTGPFTGWRWKPANSVDLEKKARSFVEYYSTKSTRLRHEHYVGILAWMLSELLVEPPI